MHTGRMEPIVVFADILGFANLVLDLEPKISHIDYAYYSATSVETLFEEFGGRTEDPLTSAFVCFHRLLDLQIERLMRADPIDSVVFSDAAYVSFRDPGVATEFAVRLMRDLIRFNIPARRGVSTGTFRPLRLATDVAEGLRRHSSQFLGSGVVRAYRAESCGLKGMRIFIHPDAEVIEDFPGELISVEGSKGYEKRTASVERELNWLHPVPPWIPDKGGQKRPSDYAKLRAQVEDMSRYAPKEAQDHYAETLVALDRMDSIAMPDWWPP